MFAGVDSSPTGGKHDETKLFYGVIKFFKNWAGEGNNRNGGAGGYIDFVSKDIEFIAEHVTDSNRPI